MCDRVLIKMGVLTTIIIASTPEVKTVFVVSEDFSVFTENNSYCFLFCCVDICYRTVKQNSAVVESELRVVGGKTKESDVYVGGVI